MKKILWNILNLLKLGGPIQLGINSQLKEDGWFNSFYSKSAVDNDSNPIPWYTYPFIKFIAPRLSKDFTVFEFGSGNSTLWLSKYVKKIIAVEHDRSWFEKVELELPSNAELLYRTGKEYSKAVSSDNSKYDIIIVDGIDRNSCVYESLNSLTERGIIIFDNSDRDTYKESFDFLLSKGFKRIDFAGIGPVTSINSCTSIFYRNNNCLGI